MEGLCLTFIESKAKVMLILIFLFSLIGVGFHWWLARRLTFVDWEEKSPRKKEKSRLFFPMGIVIVICLALPIIMIASSYDLKDCIEDPDVRAYVKFPWNVLLPAIGWETTLLANAALGSVFYWLIGSILWYIHKQRR